MSKLIASEPVEGNERNFEKLLPHEIQRFLDLLRGLGLLHPGGAHVLREVGLLGHRLPNRRDNVSVKTGHAEILSAVAPIVQLFSTKNKFISKERVLKIQ